MIGLISKALGKRGERAHIYRSAFPPSPPTPAFILTCPSSIFPIFNFIMLFLLPFPTAAPILPFLQCVAQGLLVCETDFAFEPLHFAFGPKFALQMQIIICLAHFLHLKYANAASHLKMQQLYYDLHYKYAFDMLHSALRCKVCISNAVGMQLLHFSLIPP